MPIGRHRLKIFISLSASHKGLAIPPKTTLILQNEQGGPPKSGRKGDSMSEQHPNEFVDYKEALLSQVLTLDALIILLEKKGVISKEEVIEEIKKLHEEMPVAEQ
jgi:hypothetical protein